MEAITAVAVAAAEHCHPADRLTMAVETTLSCHHQRRIKLRPQHFKAFQTHGEADQFVSNAGVAVCCAKNTADRILCNLAATLAWKGLGWLVNLPRYQ